MNLKRRSRGKTKYKTEYNIHYLSAAVRGVPFPASATNELTAQRIKSIFHHLQLLLQQIDPLTL